MSKLLIFLIYLIVSFQALSEETITGEELLNKYGTQFTVSAIEGALNAKIDSSCLKQLRPDSTTYIANKEECSMEVGRQIKQFGVLGTSPPNVALGSTGQP